MWEACERRVRGGVFTHKYYTLSLRLRFEGPIRWSVLYLNTPPSPLLEPQVDLAVLALEDAELVPRPLEPRGDLEEARLDVVDVAVEHPAIQHPVREDHKAAGAEHAVDLDEEGVERGGRRRVPRPREARVDDVEARRREGERREDVGLDAEDAAAAHRLHERQARPVPRDADRAAHAVFPPEHLEQRAGTRAEVEQRAHRRAADADGHERRVGVRYPFVEVLDKFPAAEAVAARSRRERRPPILGAVRRHRQPRLRVQLLWEGRA